MRALPIQARSRRARQSARRNAPLFRGFPALAARTVLVILLAIAQAPAASAQLPSLEAPPLPLPPALRLPLEQIKLPTPFSISLYVDTVVPNARFMALGKADGNATVVFVSSIDGNVTALVDRGGGAPVQSCVLLNRGLNIPNGIAYDRQTGALYIAAVNRITRHDGADAAALAGCNASLLRTTVVSADPAILPPQSSHGNRGLVIGPTDRKLYWTVAAPFNIGVCQAPYCTIHRMDLDGSGAEVFASGIRNAGGLGWHPQTGDLLFVGNERDKMGNNRPDDILAAVPATQAGTDWLFPYCHWEGEGPPEVRLPGPGKAISDTQMAWNSSTVGQLSPQQQAAQAANCSATAPRPLQALGPHVASLGVLYWPPADRTAALATNGTDGRGAAAGGSSSGDAEQQQQQQQWPKEYDGSVFVGEHGSWNREPPLGYRISNTQLGPDGRTATNHTVFAEGWLNSAGAYWGRPVGLLRLPDGSMLVADDWAQVVYRIAFNESSGAAGGSATSAAVGRAAAAAATVVVSLALAAAAVLLL